MNRYKIAGFDILISGNNYDYFKNRMSSYVSSTAGNDKPDIRLYYEDCNDIKRIPDGKVIANVNQRIWMQTVTGGYAFYEQWPKSDIVLSLMETDEAWENIRIKVCHAKDLLGATNEIRGFNMIGEIFRYAVLQHNGIVLHSSAISYDGKGILFSAPPGMGKSTHTGLWKKYYEKDTIIINDDTPAIRFLDGKPYVFGTPWSGKTEINTNSFAPIEAIVFLDRSSENTIRRIKGSEAVWRMITQVRKPVVKTLMDLTLEMMDLLLTSVPVYLLSCNISKSD